MSFSIEISNRIGIPLRFRIGEVRETLPAGQSLILNDVRSGERMFILDPPFGLYVVRDIPLSNLFVASESNVEILLNRNEVDRVAVFSIPGPGRYVFLNRGPIGPNPGFPVGPGIPGAPIRVEQIVERIFAVPFLPPPVCPVIANPYGPGAIEAPCSHTGQIINAINALIAPYPPAERCRIINQIVRTFVPGQGQANVTLLEAAIIMRNVPLVQYLLSVGADPNLTTTGVPFNEQLALAARVDPRVRQILILLEQAGLGECGRSNCPCPGAFPGYPQPFPQPLPYPGYNNGGGILFQEQL